MLLTLDIHIHSCLSPCGSPDMTPRNIAAMAALCGLTAFAVSDHNTCRQCPPVMAAAAEHGLLAIPAMELTTSEEAHVLCLLPDLGAAAAFSDYVYERLPDIANRPEIFGEQTVMDRHDRPAAEERRLLLSATSISVYGVSELAESFGGMAIPAHIDRPSFSVLSNLGLWDAAWGFKAFEAGDPESVPGLRARFPELAALRYVSNSDAHTLEGLGAARPGTLEAERPDARAVIDALKRGQTRKPNIQGGSTCPT
ncbi:MAG: PHP domain-containing protein [Oscillospiraceae bacterium]|nr:PHP domain-containing protein [Oscillospiraceae bacterium]